MACDPLCVKRRVLGVSNPKIAEHSNFDWSCWMDYKYKCSCCLRLVAPFWLDRRVWFHCSMPLSIGFCCPYANSREAHTRSR